MFEMGAAERSHRGGGLAAGPDRGPQTPGQAPARHAGAKEGVCGEVRFLVS